MTKKVLTTPVSDADIESLKIGDVFYLSGALITSRDMVHFRHVEEGMDLPYDLAGKAIFHAGPIMVPDDKSRSGFRVVSIGPTTSMRMEKYEREFLRKTGVKIVVGKGGMGPETAAGCQESKAVHCVFPGGCAVLAAECVEEVEERHWPELGQPESMWVMRVKEFGPLIVSIDAHGGNLFEKNKAEFNRLKEPIVEEICSKGNSRH